MNKAIYMYKAIQCIHCIAHVELSLLHTLLWYLNLKGV